MPDSGDSSRRSRRSGFGLNKPHRSVRSRNSSEVARGDVCQIGNNPSPTSSEQARGNLLSWLFGKRPKQTKAPNLRESRAASSLHSDRTRLENRRSLPLGMFGQTDLGESRVNRAPTPSERNPALRRRSRDRQQMASAPRWNDEVESLTGRRLGSWSGLDSDRQSLSNGSVPSGRSQDDSTDASRSPSKLDSRSPISFPRRRSRSDSLSRSGRLPRSPETRLQSHQPTLIQQPTFLQQPTTLQGRSSTGDSHPGKRRRQESRSSSTLPRPRSRSVAIALYAARMLILSVGVGVLAGTVLSAWNPAKNPLLADSTPQAIKQASSLPQKGISKLPAIDQLQLAQEMVALKSSIQALVQQHPGFTPGVFLIDLDNNNYVDLSGSTGFSSASTIKVPVLVAFFQDVDAGKIRLNDKLILKQESIGGGSGELQGYPPGSQFTALDVATKMITISDNTATNMLIERLGGLSALNQRFKSWGLTTTVLNSLLPDLEGTNITSPKELAGLMVQVSQGELVSLKSRDRILDIMRRTVNNSQLPQGLGEGATIAHKTGDIGKLIGDVGLVDMPSGKRYAAAVLVKRSFNDDRAYDLISKISRTVYQHLSGATGMQSRPAPSLPTAPGSPPFPDAELEGDTDAQRAPASAPITPERAPMHSNPMQASNQ